jgi:hypothetical protein
MHNLANSPFSREGEFTAKVAGTISGTGNESVQSAIIEQYLILGCGLDVSSGMTVGLTGSIGPNVGVSIGATGPSANVGGSASIGPSIQTTIKPGTITEIPLGKKEFQRNRASITAKKYTSKLTGALGRHRSVPVGSVDRGLVSKPNFARARSLHPDPTPSRLPADAVTPLSSPRA